MKTERWRQLEELFHRALDREPSERAAFLAHECAGDESLRREIESLLASHEQDGRSFDAADLAADLLEQDQIQRAVGRMFGPYKVLKTLGAGGMGAVYLATDTRLRRQIALKLLPPEFTRDRDRLRRFEQEARAASALNHPNIVTVYDTGDAGDVRYIAMELVEGVTLRERLARGRLKLGEALDTAAQVASALAAAHAAGIIHRDIKPENILLRRDGYVKVVDFGLIKLTLPPSSDGETASLEPQFRTSTGVILGTPHYMSPEQVRGAAADNRADIFSLGAVLYEMLSGRRAFQSDTAVEAMHSILNDEPPDLPPEIPPQLQRIVRRCLEKQPEKRFHSAEDLAFTLRALSTDSEPGIKPEASAAPAARLRWWNFWVPAAAILLLLAGALLLWQRTEPSWKNPLEDAQFSKLTDFEGAEINATISADGKLVAFLSDRDGPFDVWITQVGTGQFKNLTRGRFTGLVNENVQNVGFSADGANVWVRAHNEKGGSDVWLLPTLGNDTPRLFLPRGVHAAWSPDGSKLLYSEAGGGDPLFVADRDGSNPKQIFVDRLGYHAHFPTWAPDGRHVYFVRGTHVTRQMDIWRIPAAGGDPERITNQRNWVVSPVPLDDRTLLYSAPAEDGSGPWLYAVDVKRGNFHRISLGIEQYTAISATADGHRLVATVTNSTANLWRLPILDHPAPESEASQVELPNVHALGPRCGPDYDLYLSSHGGPEGLWKFKSGEPFELWKGSENGRISSPAISSDGKQVAFTLRKQGRGTLYMMSAEGTGVRSLSESLDVSGVPSWAPDGQWLAVIADKGEGPRLFKVPIGGGSPVQLIDEIAWNPVWSPDGAMIVYSGAQIQSRSLFKAVSPDGKPIRFPEQIRVLPMVERYRFLPDAKALVIMRGDWRMHQFFLLDLDTFQERPLSNLQAGFSMRSFDISPDGKYILFDRIRDKSDIVLIDLKR